MIDWWYMQASYGYYIKHVRTNKAYNYGWQECIYNTNKKDIQGIYVK